MDISAADRHEAIFARRGWLSGHPQAFRAAIIARGRVQGIGRDQQIYQEGDPAGGIYGILSGGLGVEVGSPRLSPRTGHILRAGDWFGSGPIIRGGVRSMGFKGAEASSLLFVPLVSLRIPGMDDSEVARRVAGISDIGARIGADVAADLMIPVSARRVAAVLMRVTAAADGVVPDHPDGFLLPQTLIAGMANSSRNIVNRVLKTFRDAGWIAGRYNRIRVIDARGLAAFAYSDE